jgi:serine-type D-Ala-D-Ala carboxypeptidase/endopeptidase (penicillin-binding protein 4)
MTKRSTTLAVIAAGLAAALLFGAALAPVASAKGLDSKALDRKLTRLLAKAGTTNGAVVRNAKTGKTVVKVRAGKPRPLASNTKLFTVATALDALPDPATSVVSLAPPNGSGQVAGNLFLVGGGDPALDTAALNVLAAEVIAAGVTSITGSVIGDETRFDDLRGGPSTGFAFDPELAGSLGALTFERGRAVEGGQLLADPARGAAVRFDDALEARGVVIPGSPAEGMAPAGATTALGSVATPIETLARLTNKKSDNFFAEVLAKGIGRQLGGQGTTAAGAAAIEGFAQAGGSKVALLDGSGLSRANRGSPSSVAELLVDLRKSSAFGVSLPVAGVDGTLAGRLQSAPARGNCRAKTGTLSQVSALSGYCKAGKTRLAFSLLFEAVDKDRARVLQDKAVQAIASFRGAALS